MDVKLDDGPVYVTLSRRNLVELLAELDAVRDHANWGGKVAVLSRRIPLGDGDTLMLHVEAQEDDAHYGDRIPGTFGMIT